MCNTVKTLIMFMLISEQARGRPTWSARVTWCPRALCWWSLTYGLYCKAVSVLSRPYVQGSG